MAFDGLRKKVSEATEKVADLAVKSSEQMGGLLDEYKRAVQMLQGLGLRYVLRTGRRKQDALNPQKYRYSKAFDDLVEQNTHIVAIVLFRLSEAEDGKPVPNNYVVTAYQKAVW